MCVIQDATLYLKNKEFKWKYQQSVVLIFGIIIASGNVLSEHSKRHKELEEIILTLDAQKKPFAVFDAKKYSEDP